MSEATTSPGGGVDPDLEAGQVVGEYQVECKIGQGGFGAVFKAVHPVIGKVVAIKVLARKFSVDPEMVSRFIAEAKAVNQIRHRNIIDIFSFGQLEDGRHYYVMEYLDGEPLDALLDREVTLQLPVALPILRAVARALDAAHAKGITHRDLKPENVFLGRDEDGGVVQYWPKLLDFGIAKLMASEDGKDGKVSHKTRTGIPIGTPYFMSPEQCRGKDVDHRTDYYAFGVVAYRMLTGVFPIDGDDYMDILMKQLTVEPAPPSTLVGELPPAIDDAIAWLMRKDPAARPPNLATAVRAMEEGAEASGIRIPRAPRSGVVDAARSPTPPVGALSRQVTPEALAQTAASASPTIPPPSRSKTPVIVGGLLGAVVLGAGVFFLVSANGHRTSDVGLRTAEPEKPAPAPAPVPAPAAVPAPVPASEVRSPKAEVPAGVPDLITITISGTPAGTHVLLGTAEVGTAPGPVQLPRGSDAVELELHAIGYVVAKHKLTPDRDQPLAVTLKKLPVIKAKGQGSDHDAHDIEDPFH